MALQRVVSQPQAMPVGLTSHPHTSLKASFRPAPRSALIRGPSYVAAQVKDVTLENLQAKLQKLQEENQSLKEELRRLKEGEKAKASTQVTSSPATTKAAVAADVKLDRSNYMKQLEQGIAWPQPNSQFWNQPARSTPMPFSVATGSPPSPPKDPRPLHIVHITAEMAPIAKVGGLGDVVTGLARTCQTRGHQVAVMLPFYECLPEDEVKDLKHEMDIEVPKAKMWDGVMQFGSLKTSVYWGKVAGCPVYLLRPADWNSCNIFRGGRVYGGSYNETEAYLYFCRACLEYLRVTGQQPHVLHLHEWQTCAAAMLFWEVYNQAGLWRPRLVLTIHNMDNTGECRQDEFAYVGVDGTIFASVDKALDERTIGHNPERLSLLKGGIVYCNAVTTVSPTYAQEILKGGAGGWLRSTLSRPEVEGKVRGILNGIDSEDWDPATDPALPANYSAQFPGGKSLCKAYLQRGLGLNVCNKPLVAVISRLVPQKGIHLIKAAIYRTVEKGGQFVLLGSGHSDAVFKALAGGEFKDHPDVRLLVMYSEKLAHQIYGAADMVLVPSMFEPCGLTQMIAMRYGAVPVVRKTGGLADTVRDMDQYPKGEANGYTFDGTDEGSLFGALDRALEQYQSRPEWWADLSVSNMNNELSWNRPAGDYLALYNSLAQS